MCAPCKVIINQEAEHAVRRMNLLRDWIDGPNQPDPNNPDELWTAKDGLLYRVSLKEIEFIEETKGLMLEYCAVHSIPKQWRDLIARI